MGAPKGNKYALGNKGGRNYTYTPDQFQKAWDEYFSWVDANPWYKNEVLKGGERAGEIVQVPTQRPYSEIGFCAYHNHGVHFLSQLAQSLEEKNDENAKELSYILNKARAKCTGQKFEGAAVGVFNANIIARDIGLTDKSEIQHTGFTINIT